MNILYKIYTAVFARIFRSRWTQAALMASRYQGVIYHFIKPRQVKILKLNLSVQRDQSFAIGLLEGIGFAIDLHQKKKAIFSIKKEQLFIEIEGQTILIQHEIDLFILNEIYILNEYHLIYPKAFALIDIGMNVGLVSLYFANNANCQEVFGFEPIPSTFKNAQINFELNPHLRKKITATNAGLGREEKIINFYFDALKHGNTSGISPRSKTQSKQSVSAQILEANSAINNIIQHSEINDFILKIDCEGMEFDIFETFNGVISPRIKGFLIEWHFKYPRAILSNLAKNNFTIINNTRGENLGMIYAFRN